MEQLTAPQTQRVAQVTESLKKLFKHDYRDTDVKVKFGDYRGHKNVMFVTVSAMYDRPDLAAETGGLLGFLTRVKEAIGGITELDIYSEVADPGCDTCDYGSEYGWEFVAW